MSLLALLAGAGAAGVLALASAAHPARASTAGTRPVRRPDDRAPLARARPALAPLAWVAGWAFVGGVVGVVIGAVLAIMTWRVLGRAESPATRRRRARLRSELPMAVHLLAETLRSGSAVETALRTVADALPGPCGDEFARLHHQLRLGRDPMQVWADLSTDAQLGPLGRSLGRAHESGAAVADSVVALATELRARARAEVEQRAKSVDVRASAPLGACFLPAFVLLGVVPLVAGLFTSMRLFG